MHQNALSYEIQDFYSHALMKVTGEYELEAFLDLIQNILTVGGNSESKKVICDIREVENMFPSDTERFRLGTSLADVVGNSIHIAGVAAPESINHFVELVANNRGVNFKVFSSFDAARQWLLEEDVLAAHTTLA